MCRACQWAPFFEAFGNKETGRQAVGGTDRRAVLRAGAALATTAALGPLFPATDVFAQETRDADYIFHNGPIYTVAGSELWAKAVAVKGNVIVHVGGVDEAMKRVGAKTKIIDLKGRLLMPGFVEGHTHPFLGAFLTSGLDLQLADRKEVFAAIKNYAEKHPNGPIRGFGWRVDMFPPEGPSRQELDRIVPDRPAFFFAIDGHSLWANSKALEVAGVDRNTPDPIPGFSFFVRDKEGNPTGYALEVAAVLGLVNAIEPISSEAMGQLMEGWLPKAAAAGITSVFDAGVPPIGSDQGALIALYKDVEDRGELPFRVVASYAVKELPVHNAVQVLTDIRKRVSSELVQVNVVKIIGDGSQGGYTAWLLEPYADKPDSIGSSPFSVEQWEQLIGSVDAAGFDVHVHACGERTAPSARARCTARSRYSGKAVACPSAPTGRRRATSRPTNRWIPSKSRSRGNWSADPMTRCSRLLTNA